MRLSDRGWPVIILSHRKQEFLETCIDSLKTHATGITDVIVVDDSGDHEHRQWLDDHGLQFTASHWFDGRQVGYLGAMRTVWEVAARMADRYDLDKIILWEEDFRLIQDVNFSDAAAVLDAEGNESVAQINLQRQPVYKIERRLGYLESHQRRGYGLHRRMSSGVPWVRRRSPFTTNPSMIRREVLDIDWPTRAEADAVRGGAEPAMSKVLEAKGYQFGWLGQWNQPHVIHVGDQMKTGKGY